MKMTIDVTKYRSRRKNQKMNKAFFFQLTRWTGLTVKQIIRNISGPVLKTRTAHLRRSITGRTFMGRVVIAIVGSGIFGARAVKYARIHEMGGTIKPVKAKALTVPFPGVKGRAANYPNAFLIKSKAGNALLVQSTKKGFKPLFVLKKEVTIPARHWLSKSIADMKPELLRSLQPKEIVKVMKKMGG